MFSTSIFIVTLVITTGHFCDGHNILVVFPHLGKSHFLVFEPLFKALAEKGHSLTVISFHPQKQHFPNYRDVDLNDGDDPEGEYFAMQDIPQSRLGQYLGTSVLVHFADITCPKGLQSRNFQNFLKESNHFDVMLIEFFNTNCFMGLARIYGVPVIGMTSTAMPPWTTKWFGTPKNPSYTPNMLMDYSDHMTFLERLENFLISPFHDLHYKYSMSDPGNEYSKKYLGIDLYEGGDIMYNTSMMFVNNHFSLNRPKPLTPSIIELAGIHIKEAKTLPVDLEKYINQSQHGVIYMSMGSMLKGHTFPNEKRKIFLDAFSLLPQRVIWKWEAESMDGKPDNVMLSKWAPQRDILCHPNVKVFITHGGLLGTIEAVYCGVPMIVLPQFGDQHTNARAIEDNGGGVNLKLSQVTTETLSQALRKVLSTESHKKAKELSETFRDRPLPPIETAIFWIEYVIRRRGAPQMRTAAVDMPFYQYFLIDVMAFLLLALTSVIFIIYFVSRAFLKLILRKISRKLKNA